MIELSRYPRGFVTYVFTDVEDYSRTTRRLEKLVGPGCYESNLRDPHRVRLCAEARSQRGFEIQCVGDGHLFVSESPDDALAFAVALQRSLVDDFITFRHESQEFSIRVRIGLHTARVHRKPKDRGAELPEYPGDDTNYASRISGLGLGGQVIISNETYIRAEHVLLTRFMSGPIAFSRVSRISPRPFMKSSTMMGRSRSSRGCVGSLRGIEGNEIATSTGPRRKRRSSISSGPTRARVAPRAW